MLDGFYLGSKYKELTKKQKLETRIKDGVIDLIIDRNQTFLETARKRNTSIIVQNREGGIRRFRYNNRNFISIPTSIEDKISTLNEFEQEDFIRDMLKLSTINSMYEVKQEDIDTTYSQKLDEAYTNKSGIKNDLNSLRDETGNIPEELFEMYSVTTKEEEKELDEEIEESEKEGNGTALTNKGMQDSSSEGNQEVEFKMEGSKAEREYSFEDTNLNINGNIPRECKNNLYYSNTNKISKAREVKLQALANRIVSSFKGRISKDKRAVPTARICSKTVCVDVSDKIYKTKKGNSGKHLNMNIVIDMSGSMDGEPVKNAVEILYIFNEIANAGYMNGSVLFSDTSGRCKIKLPMPRKMIGNMVRTGGGEGLGKNLEYFKKELKEVDTNICMTDGCLTEEPILKELYKKEKIEILGVYVNKDAKDLTEYTGSLNRWFTKSIVRHTVEELCEKIVQFGLRRKQG